MVFCCGCQFGNISTVHFSNFFYLSISYRLIWNFINDITIQIVRSDYGKFFINKNSYDGLNCALPVKEYKGKFLGSAYSAF